MMGDILPASPTTSAEFAAEIMAGAPIERVELRNRAAAGGDLIRPDGAADLGPRLRVVWEGSEYRGRGRETSWDRRDRARAARRWGPVRGRSTASTSTTASTPSATGLASRA